MFVNVILMSIILNNLINKYTNDLRVHVNNGTHLRQSNLIYGELHPPINLVVPSYVIPSVITGNVINSSMCLLIASILNLCAICIQLKIHLLLYKYTN